MKGESWLSNQTSNLVQAFEPINQVQALITQTPDEMSFALGTSIRDPTKCAERNFEI